MLVSGGNLFHHGKTLGLGDPITDPENWRHTTLDIHLSTGAILDVTPEKAEQMQAEQKRKDVRAIGHGVIRTHERAKLASQKAAARVAEVTKQLGEAEVGLKKAEQAEFEAADTLAGMRQQYGDDALGYPTEPVIVETQADGIEGDKYGAAADGEPKPAEPEPEPTADEPGFSALTADQLRARALGTVGGLTRAGLGEAMQQWWGIDVYGIKSPDDKLLIPKGAKKEVVLAAAIAVFEARYRVAELVESIGAEPPNSLALLAVSLEALGAVVPTDATEALGFWRDSIKPTEPEANDEPDAEPVTEDDIETEETATSFDDE